MLLNVILTITLPIIVPFGMGYLAMRMGGITVFAKKTAMAAFIGTLAYFSALQQGHFRW